MNLTHKDPKPIGVLHFRNWLSGSARPFLKKQKPSCHCVLQGHCHKWTAAQQWLQKPPSVLVSWKQRRAMGGERLQGRSRGDQAQGGGEWVWTLVALACIRTILHFPGHPVPFLSSDISQQNGWCRSKETHGQLDSLLGKSYFQNISFLPIFCACSDHTHTPHTLY